MSFNFTGRVVLSCDDNPKFLDFWPVVRSAWMTVFRAEPILALVRPYFEPLESTPNGRVYCLSPVDGIPIQNQAKIARYWLAALFDDEMVTLINDIDLMPLNQDLVSYLLSDRPEGALATLGTELYTGSEAGKFMAGHATTESKSWMKLVNPSKLDWPEWAKSFRGIKKFDEKEDIASNVHSENPNCFSDESLLRYLLSVNPIPTHHKRMPFWPYTQRALDRADWRFNPDDLKRGVYVEAHLPRPLREHRERVEPLIQYLNALAYSPI